MAMNSMQMGRVLGPGRYYGDLVKHRVIGGMLLTEATYPVGHFTPKHIHERSYFSLMLQGSSNMMRNATHASNQPCALTFHPPGVLHNGQIRKDGGRSFFVEIDSELLMRIDDQVGIQKYSIVFRGGLTNRLAARLYQEFRRMDQASQVAIEGLVLEMLAQCSRDRAKPVTKELPVWLAEAKDIIHDHYSETLSLSGIAKLVGVHPVHLATTFRRFHYCSVGDYIRRVRIEIASRELIASEASLAQIAAGLGFTHQSHFTRIFKDHFGLTPSEYRKKFRI
jgi:AraC family transcriptional regulator